MIGNKINESKVTVGEIKAYRAWKSYFHSPYLHSIHVGHLWLTGANQSLYGPGFFAFKTIDQLLKKFRGENFVYGEVELWGEVKEHNLGYTAQYAKVVSILGASPNVKKEVKNLRQKYGLPATPRVKTIRPVPRDLILILLGGFVLTFTIAVLTCCIVLSIGAFNEGNTPLGVFSGVLAIIPAVGIGAVLKILVRG